ncbi:MFS transporter [Gordonia sp. NPDC003429]
MTSTAPTQDTGIAPDRPGLVLAALILVAGVANINLAVANVALPDIGRDLDASSTQLNLVAVGYSLGLAASVLYFGVLGDRYGRKKLLVLGMLLTLPASIIAGTAPNPDILFGARVLGGISAGLAFPTTLAVITALWSGPRRTRAIALWSALGGAISATGPVMSGGLLEVWDWHSVFLVTIPLALVALGMAWFFVPADGGDSKVTVDNIGGITSIVLVGSLVISINFAPLGSAYRTAVIVLAVIAVVSTVFFVWRQLHIPVPLYDFRIASRRTFWVAAVGGIIIFGTLMGVMFIGQQYLQNVLGYSTLEAGALALPAAAAMIVAAPRSAKLVESVGSRATLLLGYTFILAGLVLALLTWRDTASLWMVIGVYLLIGLGVGFAGTPASHSLTGSVPVARAGMASSTSDLQRDLGGAVMQSILGAILTAGYAKSLNESISSSPQADQISSETAAALTKSFSSAADLAQRYPQYAEQIIAAARDAFVHGDLRAYAAGVVIVAAGAALVGFCYPNAADEKAAMKEYAAENDEA